MATKANIKIKDFSDTDVWTVQQTLDERSTYKTQFYYKGRDQYGTSVPSFDNVLDCVITVLQVHADLESGLSQQKES